MTLTEWQQTRLGEISLIYSGFAFRSQDLGGNGIPVIKIANIQNKRVRPECADHFPEELCTEKLNRYFLHPHDTLIAMTGAGSVGKVGKMPNVSGRFLVNQRVAIVRPDNSRCNPAFVYFALSQNFYETKLYALGLGAGQPNVSAKQIGELEIPFPPLPVQHRIAGILSAYDELIENSQRRIRILETMARALYREWFVHFRFPGHENHPRVASPLGEIPQGWEVCTLGDFVQFKSGFAFKSGTFTVDGEHRLVTIRNVQDGAFNPESDSRMSELPKKMPPYCMLKDGDILLSLTGNVGRVCLVYGGPFLLNQRVSKLVTVEAFDWAMTYCMFREPEMRIKLEQLSNGVAQQNLSPVLASKMEFACPPRELRQRFAAQAEPMVRRIVQLYSTAQNLRRTRDLLLPRLLSGQINLESNHATQS
ncbi:MAG: restriction endonuclease subunit S [Desulfurivibrionaceae bacterium]